MAHEELKALYEIDKQHSDKPWRFWESSSGGDEWFECLHHPSWYARSDYRRKPNTPVWHDDKEDARKWRELVAYLPTSLSSLAVVEKISQLRSPALIQGYTADQWQAIIDGKFLCEFSDADWHIENNYADRIVQVLTGITDGRFTGNNYHWPYCRPLRIKGVRQPWFGGKCPVNSYALVVVTLADGDNRCAKASEFNWHVPNNKSRRIVEFIEL